MRSSLKMSKIYPYVYKATNRNTGHFYFGYRKANKVNASEDIGIKYFSSSKYVKGLGKENFDWDVIGEFFEWEDAYRFEQEIILENMKNPLCLNIRVYSENAQFFSTSGYHHSEETKLKQSLVQKGRTKEHFEYLAKSSKNRTGQTKETSERVAKISKAKTGRRKETDEGYAKVSKTLSGRTKETHSYIANAAKSITGLTKDNCEWRKQAAETASKSRLGQNSTNNERVAKMTLSKMILTEYEKSLIEKETSFIQKVMLVRQFQELEKQKPVFVPTTYSSKIPKEIKEEIINMHYQGLPNTQIYEYVKSQNIDCHYSSISKVIRNYDPNREPKLRKVSSHV